MGEIGETVSPTSFLSVVAFVTTRMRVRSLQAFHLTLPRVEDIARPSRRTHREMAQPLSGPEGTRAANGE